MMHPAIKRMLGTLGILEMHDSLSELKIRSKYFLGYHEVMHHAQLDFKQKLPQIFPPTDDPNDKNENAIKVISIMNPKFAMGQLDGDPRFEDQKWDDDCCGTVFFCDAPNGDDDDDFPSAWMMKYELLFEDDIIQLVRKNGEHAFDPAALAYQSFSSALH